MKVVTVTRKNVLKCQCVVANGFAETGCRMTLGLMYKALATLFVDVL